MRNRTKKGVASDPWQYLEGISSSEERSTSNSEKMSKPQRKWKGKYNSKKIQHLKWCLLQRALQRVRQARRNWWRRERAVVLHAGLVGRYILFRPGRKEVAPIRPLIQVFPRGLLAQGYLQQFYPVAQQSLRLIRTWDPLFLDEESQDRRFVTPTEVLKAVPTKVWYPRSAPLEPSMSKKEPPKTPAERFDEAVQWEVRHRKRLMELKGEFQNLARAVFPESRELYSRDSMDLFMGARQEEEIAKLVEAARAQFVATNNAWAVYQRRERELSALCLSRSGPSVIPNDVVASRVLSQRYHDLKLLHEEYLGLRRKQHRCSQFMEHWRPQRFASACEGVWGWIEGDYNITYENNHPRCRVCGAIRQN